MQSMAIILALLVAAVGGDPEGEVPSQASSQPAGAARPVAEYATGVRINWARLQVELDAVVVLRSGPLELFGCSPHTREHESILRVPARPKRIHEALGLIGLTPGQPATYDSSKEQYRPATGDVLNVKVAYRQEGGTRTVDPWQWMKDARTGVAPQPGRWVFCGSRRFDDGSFGADYEGTVLCVVDFSTALIGLEERHSADNAALWLMADPDAIPPVGTRCTILIRAADGPVVIHCAIDGRYRIGDGAPLTRAGLLLLAAKRWGNGPSPDVLLRLEPRASVEDARRLRESLRELGVTAVRLEAQVSLPTTSPSTRPKG